MIVSISQPRYLPFLGYFHRMAVSEVFIYLDNVQYTPRDWENRNKVKTAQGWTWLTVPVTAGYLALIPEVLIDNSRPWQRKHWGTIESFYRKARYFGMYESRLRKIYEEMVWERLVDLNVHLTEVILDCLGIARPRLLKASELGVRGKGSDMILNLCQAVGGSCYLSGPQGRNYLKEEMFARAGVRVVYHDFQHPVYPQLYGGFEPYMAAIDLLFNCGPASGAILMAAPAAMAV